MYNKMTIKNGSVFHLKPYHSGRWTDMAANKVTFRLPPYAKERFSGTLEECKRYIKEVGAEYVEL